MTKLSREKRLRSARLVWVAPILVALAACSLFTSFRGISDGVADAGAGGDASTPDAFGCMEPTRIESNQLVPTDIAVDPTGSGVYWRVSSGAIRHLAPGADASTAVPLGASGSSSSIALAGNFIAWSATSKGVYLEPIAALDAGAPSTVDSTAALDVRINRYPASHPLCFFGTNGSTELDCCLFSATVDGGCVRYGYTLGAPEALVLSGDYEVYYGAISSGGMGILACTPGCTDNGKGKPLAAASSAPGGIAADTVNAYWTDSAGVKKVPLVGGTPVLLADAGQPGAIAVSQDSIPYWIDGTSIVKLSGGAPVVLAKDQSGPSSIATDGAYVYWTTANDGSVWKIDRSSCAP